MNLQIFLQTHLYVPLIIAGILGLIVGSFLNVVIIRYPIMLESKWRRECQRYLKQPIENIKKRFDLLIPRSHCPHCQTPIKWRHNIPVISYFILLGRCANCKKRISPIYTIIEVLTCILTILTVSNFLITWQMLAALIMTWVLIVLCFIDLRKQLLPDTITLPMLWLGLLFSLFSLYVTPYLSILGAILGYIILWIAAWLYKIIRKKEGMGHGDLKMLAVLGAWFGPQMVINILIMAIIFAFIASLFLLSLKKITTQKPIPFGPFIAVSAWISMMTGPTFLHWIIAYFL
ncbi:prepilin peptidase [Candidiatus Paracoxiella cheracis]|uniref:prepilin peptidase n=1 Tax=Candidiatus Paracoxiella cheracis TaxID=3405120 RepID=UPI003BF49068